MILNMARKVTYNLKLIQYLSSISQTLEGITLIKNIPYERLIQDIHLKLSLIYLESYC